MFLLLSAGVAFACPDRRVRLCANVCLYVWFMCGLVIDAVKKLVLCCIVLQGKEAIIVNDGPDAYAGWPKQL
jgi:hypothetical protein